MSKLILIIVGAAWMAVLLPPLVRAKLNGSPANSVTQFRRQLNSLENAGGMPRNLVRPLAPSGQRRVQQTRMPRGGGLTGALVRPEGTRAHRAPMYRSVVDMQRQRVYAIALGYEDLNDHDGLRHDLALQTAAGRDRTLASAPTLCRFENRAERGSAWAAHEVLVQKIGRAHV